MGGTDINSGGTYQTYLAQAVADGEMDVSWARLALRNRCDLKASGHFSSRFSHVLAHFCHLPSSYKMRMKAGLFDPSPTSPYKDIGSDVVGSEAHQEMSLNAAIKGMVLLKRGSLPFRAFAPPAATGRRLHYM
jgi:hypothetical protein